MILHCHHQILESDSVASINLNVPKVSSLLGIAATVTEHRAVSSVRSLLRGFRIIFTLKKSKAD